MSGFGSAVHAGEALYRNKKETCIIIYFIFHFKRGTEMVLYHSFYQNTKYYILDQK